MNWLESTSAETVVTQGMKEKLEGMKRHGLRGWGESAGTSKQIGSSAGTSNIGEADVRDMDRTFPAARGLPVPCSTRQPWIALHVQSHGVCNPPEWVSQLIGKEPLVQP